MIVLILFVYVVAIFFEPVVRLILWVDHDSLDRALFNDQAVRDREGVTRQFVDDPSLDLHLVPEHLYEIIIFCDLQARSLAYFFEPTIKEVVSEFGRELSQVSHESSSKEAVTLQRVKLFVDDIVQNCPLLLFPSQGIQQFGSSGLLNIAFIDFRLELSHRTLLILVLVPELSELVLQLAELTFTIFNLLLVNDDLLVRQKQRITLRFAFAIDEVVVLHRTKPVEDSLRSFARLPHIVQVEF